MAAAVNILKTVRPHLPLIKFPTRLGKPLAATQGHDILNITPTPIAKQPAAVPVNVAPANVAPAAPRPPVGNTPRGSGVEESQLAARFRRKPIDPMELEFIGVSVK